MTAPTPDPDRPERTADELFNEQLLEQARSEVTEEVLQQARTQAHAEAKAEWESTSLMDSIRITDLMLKAGSALPIALERYRARYARASAHARLAAVKQLVKQGGIEADLVAAAHHLERLPELG